MVATTARSTQRLERPYRVQDFFDDWPQDGRMTICCPWHELPDHDPGPCSRCPEAEQRKREYAEVFDKPTERKLDQALSLTYEPPPCDHCYFDILIRRRVLNRRILGPRIPT